MLELADRLLPLVAAGARVAVATSIDVLGSSPQLAGTSMVVTADDGVFGSVSGGCVEDAALRNCRALLVDQKAGVRRFGFGDAAAARAGLACGGELDVLVHPIAGAAIEAELRNVVAGRPAAIALVTAGPAAAIGRAVTSTTVESLAHDVPGVPLPLVRAAIDGRRDSGRSGPVEIDCGPLTLRLFVDVSAPARRMVIGGATETAVALATAAVQLGYRVTVCDPRAAFARADRFAAADEVVVGRVHDVLGSAALTARDAVCLLGHDEDLDPLALAVALESQAGFVGALGSRGTAGRRRERLLALGVGAEALERLHMPIGLDVGARTPAELAVAVLAEVLAVRNGLDAAPLHAGAGPIHRETVLG
jgi:xanthine dehydrogenase accessory factor